MYARTQKYGQDTQREDISLVHRNMGRTHREKIFLLYHASEVLFGGHKLKKIIYSSQRSFQRLKVGICINMNVNISIILVLIISTNGFKHCMRFSVRSRIQGLCALKAFTDDHDSDPQSTEMSKSILPFSMTGPGYVSGLPSSYTNQGQRELARIIVGIAVLYMSFKVKMQEVYDQANSGDSDSVESSIITSPKAESKGIRFVDVVKGKTAPKDGQRVYITAKFLHNGLRLKVSEEDDGGVDGRFVEHSNDRAKLAGAIREQYRLPEELSNVLPDCYEGMCLDGRRQASITLPSGLAPYVLPGGVIVADIEMRGTSLL